MVKIENMRTANCVVGDFRYGSKKKQAKDKQVMGAISPFKARKSRMH